MNNLDLNIKLKDVYKTLKIQIKTFYLRGFISFIPPIYNLENAIGHYIAYCYRVNNNIWKKYDDLTTKPKTVRSITEVKNRQFLIYTV